MSNIFKNVLLHVQVAYGEDYWFNFHNHESFLQWSPIGPSLGECTAFLRAEGKDVIHGHAIFFNGHILHFFIVFNSYVWNWLKNVFLHMGNKSKHQAKKKKVYTGCTKKSRSQTMYTSHVSTALSSSHLQEHSLQNALFLHLKTYCQLNLPPGDQLHLSLQIEVGPHPNTTAMSTTMGSSRGKAMVSFWKLSLVYHYFLLHLN